MAHPFPNERYPGQRPFRDTYDQSGRMYDDRNDSGASAGTSHFPHGNDRGRSPGRSTADRRPEYPQSGRGYGDHGRDEYRRRDSRSPYRQGRHSYKDRDREGYRSGSHSRSRSPRRGQPQMGYESREVMMEGFPVDMTEEDIAAELRTAYHVEGLEDIRVIRDRQTKLSRQLGFLRFPSIEQSRAFVEQNFPNIYLYGPSAGMTDSSTRVRIAYSREREERARPKGEGDWTCRMCAISNYPTRSKCFKCNAPRPEMSFARQPGAPAPKVVNSGDNDVAPETQPSQFLLIRGLDHSVTEQLLAKGVAKLYRPSGTNEGVSTNSKKGSKVASTTGDSNLGAREGSIRRVLLVRDRKTNASAGYGFAEFAGVMDAQAAMTRLKSFEKFTISSKPVMVTYIHAGVFIPVLNPSASTNGFTFSPLGNTSMQLMYNDDEAYVTELTVTSEEEDPMREQATQQSSHAKETKDSEKTKKRKADATGGPSAKKLAMPSQIQLWSNRQAELHGTTHAGGGHNTELNPVGAIAAAVDVPIPQLDSSGLPIAVPNQSYADYNKLTCWLCLSTHASVAKLNFHERASVVHRDMMAVKDLTDYAMWKLVKHGLVRTPEGYQLPPYKDFQDRSNAYRHAHDLDHLMTEETATYLAKQAAEEKAAEEAAAEPTVAEPPVAEYRDRAKARRLAIGPQGPSTSRDPAAEEEDQAQAEPKSTSKGASLLGKMGWTEGSGLGAQGTGAVNPIATEVYAQGVGLGAQGGRLGDATEEAARNTRGRYDEFLEKGKDNARQRYDEMNRE